MDVLMHNAAILIVSVAVASRAAARAEEPYFVSLGTLGPEYCLSNGFGVSADGRVAAGFSGVCNQYRIHAFRWTADAGMLPLGSLDGELSSRSGAVSWSGAVIVGEADVSDTMEAFRWTDPEGMVGLGFLSSDDRYSIANSVSADGQRVVGQSRSPDGLTHAFLWEPSLGMRDLGVLPGGYTSIANGISADGRVIVGEATNPSYAVEAFRWTEQGGIAGLGDLSGGSFSSRADAASVDGAVIVGWGQSETGPEAFRWTETEGMVGLGFITTRYSRAYAVSADGGVIVGEARGSDGRNRPFIWNSKEGMRDLQEVIEVDLGLDLGSMELIAANGVSADGRTIVGWGYNRDGHSEAWIAHLGPGCRVDCDGDGAVDTRDVTEFLNRWVQKSLLADWNYDATVDTRDFIGFLNAWVEGC